MNGALCRQALAQQMRMLRHKDGPTRETTL